MPGEFVCSASLKRQLGVHEVEQAMTDGRRLGALFSASHLSLFAAHAPARMRIDDLSVIGPIHVRRGTLKPERLGHSLTVEHWTYQDGSALLELSVRCAADAATRVAAQTGAILRAYGIDISGPLQTKTRATLNRLRPSSATGRSRPRGSAPPRRLPRGSG
jgi:hypothetical protein